MVNIKPVDLTGCGGSISQKRQDIPETNSQSAGLAERADSRVYQWGKIAEERQQRHRAGQGFQHGDGSHMSAQFKTQGICEGKSAMAKILLLSLVSVWVLAYMPHPSPKTLTLLPSFYSAENMQVRRGGPGG